MRPATLEASAPTPWDDDLVRVYRDRYGDLVRLAYLIIRQSAEAEEVVQEAFVACHRSWDGVRDPFLYVRTAVVNRCYSWGRRFQVEQRHRPPPPPPAELGADELWDALGVLNDRQRAAVVLRFYEDLPDSEIAELLGCRTATVRTAIHRGLKALRKVVDR